mmetsp:Transcript_28037/g.76126  ORF Transcript_28037/g.76126 Transcript_28037/m.76126 type:complete len:218 (-) Transcript_28037:73-726(-)
MSRISRILFACAAVCADSVRDAVAFTQPSTPLVSSSMHASAATQRITESCLFVGNAIHLYEEAAVTLEDQLVYFSTIDNDDTRRNDFEAFVTGRLREEIVATQSKSQSQSTVERLRLKSLDFVKEMDVTILKLGQAAQDRAWDGHVTSGFPRKGGNKNDIWPYVDMLIQFKLLISNMERASRKEETAAPERKGCKCTGCPGQGSCKDGKRKAPKPDL